LFNLQRIEGFDGLVTQMRSGAPFASRLKRGIVRVSTR
jgi:hypothetical protein